MTQFITQTYRAFFLCDADASKNKLPEARAFVTDYKQNNACPLWIRLPLKITLKEFAGWMIEREKLRKSATLSDYILYNIERKGSGAITSEELEELLHAMPSIFIFDGLDEVPASSNRTNVLAEISFFTETILRRLDADTIIIATTRPQGYSKEFDSSRYRHLQITDLQRSDCSQYLKLLLDNIIDNLDDKNRKLKILEKSLENEEIARLMKSPLQASIMAILVKSGGDPPRNKFDLFTNYYEIIFKREKQRGISAILSDLPTYVHEIHNQLGLYLQTVSEKNFNPSATITKSEFIEIVEQYLNNVELETEDVRRYSQEIIQAATDRLVFISEIQDQRFGFAIRSLQEYFAAQGYFNNVDDENVRKRLHAIHLSSYWCNTLLFAVGLIAKTKIYQIDYIETICNKLNGSEDEIGERSLTSLAKVGSWLALDILNEGVLNGNPKIENKFCKLLRPLFHIPLLDKHKEIANLPPKIIEKWVIDFMRNALCTDRPHAALTVCAYLENNGYSSTDVLIANWPSDLDREIYFLTTLIAAGNASPYVKEKTLRVILSEKGPDFFESIYLPKNADFIQMICESSLNTDETRRMLFELIFVASMNDELMQAIPFFKTLGVKLSGDLPVDFASILHDNQMQVEMVNGYSYQINLPKVDHFAIVDLTNYAANKSTLVFLICSFITNPGNKEFEELNNYLFDINSSRRESIINQLIHLNAFFFAVYYDERKNFAEWKTFLMEIERLNVPALEGDSVLMFDVRRKYSLYFSCSLGNHLDMIDAFISAYLTSSNLIPTEAYISFFRLFDFAFQKMSEEQAELLKKSSRSIIIESAIRVFAKTEIIYMRHLPVFFYFLNFDEVEGVISNSKVLITGMVFLPDKDYFRSGYTEFVHRFAARKINDLIDFQFINGKNIFFSLLLQQTINQLQLFNKIDRDLLYFRSLVRPNSNGSDEKYRVLLLILNPEIGDNEYCQFEHALKGNTEAFADESFAKIVVFLLKYITPGESLEKIYALLHDEIKDDKNRSELIRSIRNYVGNKPSTVLSQVDFK